MSTRPKLKLGHNAQVDYNARGRDARYFVLIVPFFIITIHVENDKF